MEICLLYHENRKIFQCHLSYKTIGQSPKMSRNTVSKYVKLLEQKQLIRTESTDIRTANDMKRNVDLLYAILPIEQLKMYYYEQQSELAKLLKRQRKAG